jgi:hypothetical protein
VLFLVISILPASLYYIYQFFENQALSNQVFSSFLPGLWFKVYYWQFWLKHLWRVIGFSTLVGGMFGILIAPAGWQRNFLIAMWVGYFIFGLFYTYYIHTHDYYHLQFIPAVAFSLGIVGAVILRQLYLNNSHRLLYPVIYCILLLAIILNIGLYLNTMNEQMNLPTQTDLAKQIGSIVNHSPRTLFLSPYYGYPLQYHGELSGKAWPTRGDINSENLMGLKSLTTQERLEHLIQADSPEYFIITDMEEYAAQPKLQSLLMNNYPLLMQSDKFIIFDLH